MADFNPEEMDKAAEEAKSELTKMLKLYERDDSELNAVLSIFGWWNKHYLKTGHKRLGRTIISIHRERNKESTA